MLQLRDEKPDIDFPGYWGLFGGEINVAENPEDAARRELYEEIRYNPTHINLIGKEILPELGGIVVYTYFCSLYTPLNMLSLNEGMDFGLFTMKDIKKGKAVFDQIGRNVSSRACSLCVRKNTTGYMCGRWNIQVVSPYCWRFF